MMDEAFWGHIVNLILARAEWFSLVWYRGFGSVQYEMSRATELPLYIHINDPFYHDSEALQKLL